MRAVSVPGSLVARRDRVQSRVCVGVPEGIEPVTGFEVERYMGRWYEVARLDHSFERGMEQVTATYELRPDGTVAVLNRGYRADKGEWGEASGKARFLGEPDVAALKVSFFGPFYGGYNVVDLDPRLPARADRGPEPVLPVDPFAHADTAQGGSRAARGEGEGARLRHLAADLREALTPWPPFTRARGRPAREHRTADLHRDDRREPASRSMPRRN